MAAALPILSAVAPIISPILGNLFAPKPQAPQLAPPPAPPTPQAEPTVEPEGVLDREAARARSIARRKAASQKGGLLALEEEEKQEPGTAPVSRKTLLGS